MAEALAGPRVGWGRSALSPFGRWVSPARPPNRTCDSHRIRLSMCSCRRKRRPESAVAHWCSFVCMASTRDSASTGPGHEAPVFTSDLSSPRIDAASTLDPFAMYTAFPCSDYYGSSAPLRRHRPATGLPRRDGRDQRSGSHVHSRTLQQGRCPAMPLQPRHGYAAVLHRAKPCGAPSVPPCADDCEDQRNLAKLIGESGQTILRWSGSRTEPGDEAGSETNWVRRVGGTSSGNRSSMHSDSLSGRMQTARIACWRGVGRRPRTT